MAAEGRTFSRGTTRLAINVEHSLVDGRLDNKPINFISTANTMEIGSVE